MRRSSIGGLVFVLSMFLLGQVAIGQTSSPQMNQQSGGNNSPSNATPARPQRQAKQQQQQQYKQQPEQQRLPQSQLQTQQQHLPQQTLASQQSRFQQEDAPVSSQQARQDQQQQRRQQLKARRARHPNPVPASVMSYATALQKCSRERHSHVWWTEHYPVIVFSVGGYYYFDSGYWFPALGYSPNYEAYDYDGPIYTYGNLLPDQVILNVQRALTDLGYYAGALSGSLSAATRYAISAYQQDNDLVVNGIVDAPLVYSLGLQ